MSSINVSKGPKQFCSKCGTGEAPILFVIKGKNYCKDCTATDASGALRTV